MGLGTDPGQWIGLRARDTARGVARDTTRGVARYIARVGLGIQQGWG